ncbi:unnamed protein product [Cochlearia groenlandica]
MATKASHLVAFLLSLLLMLLLISFHVGISEATNRNTRQGRRGTMETRVPPKAPIYLPPSRSRRGKGQ